MTSPQSSPSHSAFPRRRLVLRDVKSSTSLYFTDVLRRAHDLVNDTMTLKCRTRTTEKFYFDCSQDCTDWRIHSDVYFDNSAYDHMRQTRWLRYRQKHTITHPDWRDVTQTLHEWTTLSASNPMVVDLDSKMTAVEFQQEDRSSEEDFKQGYPDCSYVGEVCSSQAVIFRGKAMEVYLEKVDELDLYLVSVVFLGKDEKELEKVVHLINQHTPSDPLTLAIVPPKIFFMWQRDMVNFIELDETVYKRMINRIPGGMLEEIYANWRFQQLWRTSVLHEFLWMNQCGKRACFRRPQFTSSTSMKQITGSRVHSCLAMEAIGSMLGNEVPWNIQMVILRDMVGPSSPTSLGRGRTSARGDPKLKRGCLSGG